MLLHGVLTCLFSLLCNSPACGRTSVYSCGRLLVGIWVVSSSERLCPVQHTAVNTCTHSVVLYLGARSWVPRRAQSALAEVEVFLSSEVMDSRLQGWPGRGGIKGGGREATAEKLERVKPSPPVGWVT